MHYIAVSPLQYRQGFQAFIDGKWTAVPYTLIRQLPSGDYLVQDPAFQGQITH